ncbi:nitrite reductase small subunit NirD [Arthrobacter sp. RCC_34]|uniref:nitrite reductase small subunit NirD n=1 Tax=Arthrobacter sp. RCC_34 TaxID=3239230 RepID=UPI003523F390
MTAAPDLLASVSDAALPGLRTSACTWHSVCRVQDLEPNWGEAALVNGIQVALFLLPTGEVYAVEHRDPMTGAHVMARGIVGSRQGKPTIAAPLHKEVYSLADGSRLDGTGAPLAAFSTRLVDGVIQVAA